MLETLRRRYHSSERKMGLQQRRNAREWKSMDHELPPLHNSKEKYEQNPNGVKQKHKGGRIIIHV